MRDSPTPTHGRIRVLHVIDTGGPGGAETVLANIAGNLDPHRFDSRVLVPTEDWLYERLSSSGVPVKIVRGGGSPDLGLLWGLVREMRAFDPQVVHTHLLTSGVYGSMAAAITGGRPLVATFHGEPDVPVGDPLISVKGALLSRRKNRIVFVADHLRAELGARLRLRPASSCTIHNGVPLPPEARSRRSEVGGSTMIGALGNIRPAKDYPTLVRAAALVCRRRADVHFSIAGSGSEDDLSRLSALRDDLGIPEARLRFLGFVSDPTRFLEGLDMFLSTSVTEGLPLAVVEAAALGIPIVATACPGTSEVIGNRETLAAVGDPAAVAARILEVLEHFPGAQAMARRRAPEVRSRFGLARMLREYTCLYEAASLRPRPFGERGGSSLP